MAKSVQKAAGPNKRSPNYPSYSLEECVGFISKLYKQVGFREVHVEEAVQYMGHSPTSSTSNRVLASLDSFGLIEDRGGGEGKLVWLSRLAQEMMLEKTGKDSIIPDQLLQQAAFKDSMVLSIWNKWGPNLPSRNNIEKALVFDFNFSQPGAHRFASVLIDTYNYARLQEQVKETEEEDETNEPEFQSVEHPRTTSSSTRPNVSNARQINEVDLELTDYTLPLKGGKKKVILRAPLGLNNEDFNHIINWINLLKIGLVTEVDDNSKDNHEL